MSGLLSSSCSDEKRGETVQLVVGVMRGSFVVWHEAGISLPDAKRAFKTRLLAAHGYVAMYAVNKMQYDERKIEADLILIFEGTV